MLSTELGRLLFTQPAFTDQGKTYTTRLLYALFWTLMIASTLYAAMHTILQPKDTARWLSAAGAITAVSVMCLHLIHRGNTRLASILGLVQIWLIISFLAITGGGVNSSVIAGYLVVILAGGLLLGTTGGLATAGLCILSELFIAYLGSQGSVPASPVQHSTYSPWTMHSLFAVLVVVFQNAATRTIRMALARANQELDERKRAEVLQVATFRIAQAADTSLNLDSLYRSVHGIIKEVMPAENFYIALYDDKNDLISFPYFIDEVDAPSLPHKPGKGLTEYVLRTSTTLLCYPSTHEDLMLRGEAEMIGIPSPVWLGVPLVIGNRPIGVMAVQHYTDPHAYGEREKQILEYVALEVANVITKKQAEEELRQSEERFRNLVDHARDVIFSLSHDGIITSLNPAFEQITGWSRNEWIGKSFTSIIRSEDLQKAVDTFRQGIQGIPTPLHELRIKTKGGNYVTGEFTTTLQFSGNEIIGLIGIVRDITERNQLQEKLRQTQKLESLGTLAGGIAHDFNNILGIIMGYASFLERIAHDPRKVAQTIDPILKATRRGAGLVNQLLTFARKSDITFEPVNVNHVIEELGNMLEATFPKTITFAFDLDASLPHVVGDHNQLHQAILNLCVNSRDAMPGGGEIKIRSRILPGQQLEKFFNGSTAGHYISVEVEDTGTGMSESTRSKIFEPFFTTKEKGKGTGLGLAVVYGVVKSHQGFVDVQSELARGTIFTMYLPVKTNNESQVLSKDDSSTENLRGNELILIVEDEQMLSDLITHTLQRNGYEVISAVDGEQAVELYRAHSGKIALVLSDLGLPKKDGISAFRQMKEINSGALLVLASGYIDPETREKLQELQIKHFMQKPYNLNLLLKIIRQTIDDAGRQQPAA